MGKQLIRHRCIQKKKRWGRGGKGRERERNKEEERRDAKNYSKGDESRVKKGRGREHSNMSNIARKVKVMKCSWHPLGQDGNILSFQ